MELQDFLIIIAAGLIVCFVLTFIINKLKTKVLFEEIQGFCEQKNYKFTKANDNRYDCVIEDENFIMYCAICKIPSNSSVTINSKNTWCLRFGGKRQGRNYPNMRYLNELKPFLNFNPSKKGPKEVYRVVVFHPGTEIILRYMNESEIMEIKPDNVSYGFKAITYSNFFKQFDELLKINKKDLTNPYNN